MMALAPNAEATYAELWTSFASLIRSYTAAHELNHDGLNRDGLNHDRRAVVEVGSGCIRVRSGSRWLRLTHDNEKGTWQREDTSGASFILQLDGQVAIDGGLQDMDAVAERLAREITQ